MFFPVNSTKKIRRIEKTQGIKQQIKGKRYKQSEY